MDLVTSALLLLGFGFLIANAKLAYDYARFLTRRRAALLTWRIPKPPQYSFALGVLVFVKLVVLRRQAFGEAMMFAYYAYFSPMALTIGRGFYEDGIRDNLG